MAKAVPQLAPCRDAARPVQHQRITNAAAVRVLLVALQRRVGRHRPAMREVAVRVGATDVVDARDLLRQRFRPQVVRAHRVDHAQRPALLAGAVVRQHQHQRVVGHAAGVQEVHQPADLRIGVLEHRGIGCLQAGEQAPLIHAVLGPGLDHVVARRQLGAFGHQAQCLLALQALLALHVPAVGEQRVVLQDQLTRGLVRRVAGTQRQPLQPRGTRCIGLLLGQVADGLVDQVLAEVVAGLVRAGRVDGRVVAHQFGRVLVGLGVHEAVEAVEAAAQRPAVVGAARARLRQRRHVPLAQHRGAPAVRAQHLGDGAGLLGDLAAVARKAAVEVGQAAHAHRVVVAPAEQRRARGAAHRRGVKAREAQPLPRQPVDVRRGDGRSITAEIRETYVVEQDHQDVGRARRPLRRRGPGGRGVGQRAADAGRGAHRPAQAAAGSRPRSASLARGPYLSRGGQGRDRQCGSNTKLDTWRPVGTAPLPKPSA